MDSPSCLALAPVVGEATTGPRVVTMLPMAMEQRTAAARGKLVHHESLLICCPNFRYDYLTMPLPSQTQKYPNASLSGFANLSVPPHQLTPRQQSPVAECKKLGLEKARQWMF